MIEITPHKPVLIAGPTASGKSALALHIARTQGGVIVNADALQVYQGWPILTAQPSRADLAAAPHALYGCVPVDGAFDLGDWIDQVAPLLNGAERPIIVGGTGLYLTSLTSGLSPIPPIPHSVRAKADTLDLAELILTLDAPTRQQIDLRNRMRVQRAWEVLTHTGHGMAHWHNVPAKPLLPMSEATCIVLDAPKDWLSPRIEKRFDLMINQGLLDEAQDMLPHWNPLNPSSKAIGAAEAIAHISGDLTRDALREAIVIKTRQYAKRQRTWFRAKMADWAQIPVSSTAISTKLRFLA